MPWFVTDGSLHLLTFNRCLLQAPSHILDALSLNTAYVIAHSNDAVLSCDTERERSSEVPAQRCHDSESRYAFDSNFLPYNQMFEL